MLQVRELDVSYGSRRVLEGISLEVKAGQCLALVGPNGAGKTTLARTLAGVGGKARGSVLLDGKALLGMSGDRIVKSGLSLVPERGGAFGRLTVWENLEISLDFVGTRGPESKAVLDYCFQLFPVLRDRFRQRAATLSGGERRMLLIARALLTNPKLIVMDEPSLGLSPVLTNHVIKDVVPRLTERGIGVLLIEQNARLALAVADRAIVLERGRVVLEGSSRELMESDLIRASYLGL